MRLSTILLSLFVLAVTAVPTNAGNAARAYQDGIDARQELEQANLEQRPLPTSVLMALSQPTPVYEILDLK